MHLKLLIFLFLFLTNTSLFAQNLLRQVIGSGGSSFSNNELRLQSTVGQSSLVSSEEVSDYLFLSQGFNKTRSYPRRFDNWEVVVYPNPNNGNYYFFTTLKADEDIDFSVCDASGRLVKKGNGKGQEKINVNLQNVVAGIYFMRVSTNYHTITLKIDIIQ